MHSVQTTKYTVLQPDGGSDVRYVTWPVEPGYEAIRDVVEPILKADLEHVTVLYKDKRTDMFVDDCGALKHLPRNDAATEIYRAAYLKRHPDTDKEKMPAIYGTAIIFDRQVWY
jgi:hypothetical protein